MEERVNKGGEATEEGPAQVVAAPTRGTYGRRQMGMFKHRGPPRTASLTNQIIKIIKISLKLGLPVRILYQNQLKSKDR